MRQPSTRSFIRFKHLSRVDFPQPEGPINAVMDSVLMMAGIMDTFSLLYSQAKREGFKLGTPLTTM